MKIIGFGHRQRVGKDLACKILHKELLSKRQRPVIRSFASYLKEVAYRLFMWGGMQNEAYYEANPEAKERTLVAVGKTPREIMIELGNKVREIHPDTWIHLTLDSVPSSTTHLLISDVRYPNEARNIQARGGKVVRIDRPTAVKTDDIADNALEGYTNWDQIIINSGSEQAFKSKLLGVIHE